jgi:inorganic pyrophosphatase
MTNLATDLPPGPNPPDLIYAVIEIPMRSRNKYQYDEQLGFFYLDRVLPSPFGYPLDYGFVPQTLSEDGDTLDILVMLYESTFPGCVLRVRPIGVARMKDEKGNDDKIMAVTDADPRLNNIHELADLGDFWYRGITHFFKEYKRLSMPEQWAEIMDWQGKAEAKKIIIQSIERFKQEHKKS